MTKLAVALALLTVSPRIKKPMSRATNGRHFTKVTLQKFQAGSTTKTLTRKCGHRM
ncbi:hypothetical protein PYCH_16450 [Pyrococcus yayanosii CH1]|uniref:Uncharacterized protein n=1 Tax=Pyrococcus yayanosii (strain CH1 / JCM 16557) TaxID=529709 RepID=F8AH81_PYRYC|nr:hypothetical protein PYCH_16450 [Pyrococcus yayanosii CH1]